MADRLPKSTCPLGYTADDLAAILGPRVAEFGRWMFGQTGSICEGRRYNYDTRSYEATECAADPHGMVVYGHDLQRFLDGRPVVD